ncbi:MAG: hypothetical protein ABR510_08410 [Trueperaceae bacterium]
MTGRLALALRTGARTALAVLLVQAAVAVALAAALPEVGHVHPAGTDAHAHALVEVGGLAVPPEPHMQAPRPIVIPARRAPLAAPTAWPRDPRRTRWGRAPPRQGVDRPVALRAA